MTDIPVSNLMYVFKQITHSW